MASPPLLPSVVRRGGVAVGALLALCIGAGRSWAQYDKVLALGSDSFRTPIGGPASSPPISTDPYDAPDLRPVGWLNDRLPKWLQLGLDERLRYEGYEGSGFKPGNDDTYLLNRFRFGAAVRPAQWLRVVAQVQDARSFWQEPPVGPPNEVTWDLKLAYAELGNPETQPVSLRVGRLILDYNNTMLANSEWRNQARSFDGAAADIRLDRLRLSLFAASVVVPTNDGISHHQDGNDIYGAYATIAGLIPKSRIEPFVFRREAPSVAVESGGAAETGRLREQAYGLRIAGREISNLDYRAQAVVEDGSAGPNAIDAWACTFGVGYTVPSAGWKPRFFAGYDYASGDRDPADGVHGTFDTMYPTAHDRFGIADQAGWQNVVAARLGATVTPHRRWSLTAQVLALRLASATDALYSTSGTPVVRDRTGGSGRDVGDELDFYTWYEINREVHVGAGIGHLRPGEFLKNASKGAPYTTAYFVVEMFDGRRLR